MKHALALTLAATLLAGCPIGNNKYPKPRDLSPAWRIDKARVLAVVADPPEIAPGETATFRALLVDPDDQISAVVWLACPPSDDGGIGFGCTIDPSFDFTTATPEQLAEAGFIGFEPLVPPVYNAPPDLLADLDTFAARDGIYVLVQIAGIPGEVLDEGFTGDDFDFNQVEVAYKRLLVSTKDNPNQNPGVRSFTVDGAPVPAGAVVEIDAGESYEIGLTLTDGSIEIYDYENKDGVVEQRNEEPYISWYADGGTILEPATLFPYLNGAWAAPAAEDPVQSGTWWAVVRDRRGGMAWVEQPWRVRGAE